MNIDRTKRILFIFIFFLTACARQEQAPSPIPTSVPPTAALIQPNDQPTESPIETPTEVPTEIPTEVPSNTDPSLFGALSKDKIDPLASNIQDAIFSKAMDGFIGSGNIIEYRIIASEAFPSSDGTIIVEVYYNVRTTDSSWLVDGGTLTDNNWIQNKCNRFDFVNTATEFQLKNRRTCN